MRTYNEYIRDERVLENNNLYERAKLLWISSDSDYELAISKVDNYLDRKSLSFGDASAIKNHLAYIKEKAIK